MDGGQSCLSLKFFWGVGQMLTLEPCSILAQGEEWHLNKGGRVDRRAGDEVRSSEGIGGPGFLFSVSNTPLGKLKGYLFCQHRA